MGRQGGVLPQLLTGSGCPSGTLWHRCEKTPHSSAAASHAACLPVWTWRRRRGRGGGGGGKEQRAHRKTTGFCIVTPPWQARGEDAGWETVARGLVAPPDKVASPDTSVCQTGILAAGQLGDNMRTLLFSYTRDCACVFKTSLIISLSHLNYDTFFIQISYHSPKC